MSRQQRVSTGYPGLPVDGIYMKTLLLTGNFGFSSGRALLPLLQGKQQRAAQKPGITASWMRSQLAECFCSPKQKLAP